MGICAEASSGSSIQGGKYIMASLSLRHIYKKYPGGVTAVSDFNLEIKAGQKVAIVGKTGSGKTTLINLLTRFYDVDNGRILLDGKDIRDGNRRGCSLSDGLLVQASPCTVYDHAVQISSFIDQTPIFRETASP